MSEGLLMRWVRAAVVSGALALGASGCTQPERGSPDVTVIGKCAFTGREESAVEPGDVLLYALRDGPDDDGLGVVTGVAVAADSLLDLEVRQAPLDVLLARRPDPYRLEFGGLAADRSGDADHFVGMGAEPGEVFVSIGTTYGTTIAYPTCVFWE